MNPTTFPAFLNAACARPMPDVFILRYETANPTQEGFTITEGIKVKTTYNGAPHIETYPAGTTSISFLADAETDVIIIGSVTSFSVSGSKISAKEIKITSNSISFFKIQYPGMSDNTTLETLKIISDSIPEIYVQYCAILNNLELNTPAATKIDLQGSKGLTALNVNKCSSLTDLSIANTPSLITLDARDCVNLAILVTGYPKNNTLKYAYFRATIQAASESLADYIGYSSETAGTVYLNSDDAYYQTVADAATAQGWTIEALPA